MASAGRYTRYFPWILPWHSRILSAFYLVCSKHGFCESWDWTLSVHQFLVSWMSSLVRGPLRTLWVVKRRTQAWMRRARRKSWRSRSSSNTLRSCSGFARLSTSLMTFASSSEVSDFMVTGFFGHISGLRSHAEPFYQSSALVTWLPWLARSAGLSVVGTCLHWICGYCLTFCARLETNCRYWPFPTIQWRATVLSSQP